ncbi:MAG TPA: DUF899 domain-containing protein [Humisphaera sp.]
MTTTMTKSAPPGPKVVSRDEWLAARLDLLAAEKAATRQRDELARRRQQLPWVKVETAYTFDTPQGKRSLADLFAERSQLVVYHFMLGPGWPEGCPSCSMLADGFDPTLVHLTQRDVSFCAVSRAPLAEIEPFKKRMVWRFPWVSSFGTEFNRDFGVLMDDAERKAGRKYNYGTVEQFPSEEAPGLSVFAKGPGGAVYHTYSTYSRGLDPLLGVYGFIDLTPKGRDEAALPWPMAWVRHHDRYEAPVQLGIGGKPSAAKSACGCATTDGCQS